MSSELPDAEDAFSYNPDTETYSGTFDNRVTAPSIAIVKMMANICDHDPTEFDPLYNVLDPDALDQFLQAPIDSSHAGDRTVEFTFQDHIVTILSCGIIKVRPVASKK